MCGGIGAPLQAADCYDLIAMQCTHIFVVNVAEHTAQLDGVTYLLLIVVRHTMSSKQRKVTGAVILATAAIHIVHIFAVDDCGSCYVIQKQYTNDGWHAS